MSRSARSADPRRGPARARSDKNFYRTGHARDVTGPHHTHSFSRCVSQGRARPLPARLGRARSLRREDGPLRRLGRASQRATRFAQTQAHLWAALRAATRFVHERRPGGPGDTQDVSGVAAPTILLPSLQLPKPRAAHARSCLSPLRPASKACVRAALSDALPGGFLGAF